MKVVYVYLSGITIDYTGANSSQPRPSFLRRMFIRSRKKGTPKKSNSKQVITHNLRNLTPTVTFDHSPLAHLSKHHDDRVVFSWLPDVTSDKSVNGNQKPKRLKRSSYRKSSRSSSLTSPDSFKDTVSWSTTQRMVLCAIVFEEFCKELAALCVEHSARS
ncbi:hypothetical protein PHET_05102 [Paragonimus heterotremus]|uniref:Uncharacterized protein n=1 Tax=Paragonimus heterotremus TaxID=100268 RepID=A0A8J4TBK8_9TREM|nr:hypothetical protein PHET_05102 [Paragonimus heterotremus]